MTLHLLYKRERQPSTRIRLVQMVPHLEKHGLRCRLAACPRRRAERDALLRELEPGDRVLVHRALPSARTARFWRRLPQVLVFDFDDAIMVRKKPLLGSHRSTKRMRGFRRMLAASDGVTCGNSFLASLCEGGDLPVLIAPSAVPLDVPRMQDRGPNVVPCIGWVGLGSNLRYVRLIEGALRRLAAEREFALALISDQTLAIDGVRVEWKPWSLPEQESRIAGLDVGIMPLGLDNDWSRGKCAYKLLQYMAAGVPVVGSDVGMNAELVEHGRNGLLARSEDDWLEALRRLVDDAAWRDEIGRAGRASIEVGYSYEEVAARLARFIAGLEKRR